MEMGGVSLDPEVREGLRRSWKALMAVGILAILIGCVAIVVPAVASVGTAIFIGWILVIAGAFLVAGAFTAHTIGSVILRLLWEEQRLVIETDGEQTHGTRAAFQRDRWRDQLLASAGYRTARVTWRQLDDEPSAILIRIKRMLAA